MRPIFPAALLAVAAISPANAQGKTGNDLLRLLEGDASDRIAAYSFIDGTTQALAFVNEVYDRQPGGPAVPHTPYPKGVTMGQVADALLKWLRNNPEKRHYLGAVCVWSSWLENFSAMSKSYDESKRKPAKESF